MPVDRVPGVSESQFIVRERDLVGKTIARVSSVCTQMALWFTDGSVAVLDAHVSYGDDVYLTLKDARDLTDTDLRGLGLIDEAEYARRMARADEARTAAREQHERRELSRLMAKYGHAGR